MIFFCTGPCEINQLTTAGQDVAELIESNDTNGDTNHNVLSYSQRSSLAYMLDLITISIAAWNMHMEYRNAHKEKANEESANGDGAPVDGSV